MGAPKGLIMIVMVLHLLSYAISSTTSTSISTSTSSNTTNNMKNNHHQHHHISFNTSAVHFYDVDVQKIITNVKTKFHKMPRIQELSQDGITNNHVGGKWKLKLVHRDVISASSMNFSSHRERLHNIMKRDVRRVKSLTRRLMGGGGGGGGGGSGSGVGYEVNDFGTEVISGIEQGSGEYFVRIGVGSPPRDQYMVIDSGSDIVWVQCQPCNQCYKQSDPVFNPSNSVSFTGVSCSSTVCGRLENAGCRSGRCRYEVAYGDGSYTKGTLALETITLGSTVVHNVAIGCGHKNHGLFTGAAGLLGLGGGSMSFIGQLGGATGGTFGYCLVSRDTNSYGSLAFGREAMPIGAVWVPLVRNARAPSFYYVSLTGLSVGGVRIPVPEDLFSLSEIGEGGVVMDTGTAVTRLPLQAYEALRDFFIAGTTGLPRTEGVSIFDTCYDLFNYSFVQVPTVSLHFFSGPILTLPARNFLIPVDEMGTFCFAFAPTSSNLSIIGNIQQEGIQISFDGANGFVGFGPNTC